ncbi:hypothetical protein [Polaromonas hydrogenivorans]|uniref:Uncharacterized protein n=1 Tax=Polaromonas hydrogenivorans TaxID=335476 RepID=A0AAU7LWE1_9BURK
MEVFQIIAPLIGVILGSTISGIGVYFRSRTERKRLIACALSDLLEIRHYFVNIDVILREIKSRTPISQETVHSFRTQIKSIIPMDSNIHERYEEAISLLAGIDPVLAFKMRSKNKILDIFDTIRQYSTSNGASPFQIEEFETILRTAITPAMDKAVLELAALHSSTTSQQVKEIVASANGPQPKIASLLDNITNMVQQN